MLQKDNKTLNTQNIKLNSFLYEIKKPIMLKIRDSEFDFG